MDNIAYKERDIEKIKIQERKSIIYKVIRKISRKIFKFRENNIQKVLVYVGVCTQDEYFNLVNKFLFAFPYKEDFKIDIYLSKKLDFEFNDKYKLKFQRNYLNSQKNHIGIVHKYSDSNYDLVLIKSFSNINKFLFKIHKTAIIDENFFSVDESAVYQN